MQNYALSLEEELPVQTLPDVGQWSENYAFIGYDYEQRVGFGAYIGRWVKNPALWREQLYLYLPDGSVLSHIQIGRASDSKIPTGGSMQFRCEEAAGRWRINFEGAMRHDRLERLLKEPVAEATPHNVSFDVVIDHTYPVWMFPTSDNSSYGKFHYEQMGHCKGQVSFAGQDFTFAANAYRDHSRGPRHLGDYDGHAWLQLYLPGGPAFATYQVWHNTNGEAVRVLDQAVAVHPDRFGNARLNNSVRLPTLGNLLDPIKVDVTIEGRNYQLSGEPLSTFFGCLTEDFDFFYGCQPAIADFYAVEQPVIFSGPDGPINGYLQRSGRFDKRR